ncbi:MAG: anhydro-N-acetylmuramic acid kinase [Bacteroidia bacterium]
MAARYHVIGLMSGTSLDGLDIAYCSFKHKNNKWHFSINAATTVSYNSKWLKKLQQAHQLPGIDLLKLHNEYGRYLGEWVVRFVKSEKIRKIDFVSSHGHTIFHLPREKLTFQLGSGAEIAAACRYPVISDFRSLDVALNGQGAPLVPIGDKLLFGGYEYCINLGGFANISFDKKGKRIAYDICPANIALNYFAVQIGRQYDKNGQIAAKGKIAGNLLEKLNMLDYYKLPSPKSLGREWFETEFLPVVNKAGISIEDKIATVTNHIAEHVAKVVQSKKGKVLITGGGAFNTYLVKQLQAKMPNHKLILPGNEIIKYKEALVFAFLGVLRMEEKINCLCSVTGADRNNKGGIIWSS